MLVKDAGCLKFMDLTEQCPLWIYLPKRIFHYISRAPDIFFTSKQTYIIFMSILLKFDLFPWSVLLPKAINIQEKSAETPNF